MSFIFLWFVTLETSSLATAPSPTASMRGLARLKSTFPKPSTACRKMPACGLIVFNSVIDIWHHRWSHLNSSGPVSPCYTCQRHCLHHTLYSLCLVGDTFCTKEDVEAYMTETPLATSRVLEVKIVHTVNNLNKLNNKLEGFFGINYCAYWLAGHC